MVVDYVFKWIEAVGTPTNDARVVTKFLVKNILSRHNTPRVIISGGGTHFWNKIYENFIEKYGVKHKVATVYHPQCSGQSKTSNRGIKRNLEKVVNPSRYGRSRHLDDALLAYRIAIKTLPGLSSYRLVYGKACHLTIELVPKAFWAIKTLKNLFIQKWPS